MATADALPHYPATILNLHSITGRPGNQINWDDLFRDS
jgi:hypothetical protein